MNFRKTALMLAVCLSTSPVAAFAQDMTEDNKIRLKIELDDRMQQAETVYQRTQENLTPQQQDYLAKLDNNLAVSLGPDARIMQTESYLNACIKSDRDIAAAPEKYTGALAAWRSDMNSSGEKLRSDHRAMTAKADFIDPQVLQGHLETRKAVLLSVIDGVVKQNIKDGTINCGMVKDTLSAYL